MTEEKNARNYPHPLQCTAGTVEIDLMKPADRETLVRFVNDLPVEDLLFVPRDITHPKVIDAWFRALESGRLASLVARHDGVMVGCTSIYTDTMSWSRHVGELRVLIDAGWRGKGLGRGLIQECFVQALGLGLRKLVAQMTTRQTGAIAIFEDLGFRPEALLREHVADRGGAFHDLIVMSHDIGDVATRHSLYGLDTAAGGG